MHLNRSLLIGFAIVCGLRAPWLLASKPGDVATGQIVSDDGNVLQLNTTPCADTPHMVTFVKPWKIGKKNPKKCDLKKDEKEAKSYDEVNVQQLDSPANKLIEPPDNGQGLGKPKNDLGSRAH